MDYFAPVAPLRIDQIVAALYNALHAWAAQNKAQVSISKDPFNTLEILGSGPEGLRLIVEWLGDELANSDVDYLPIVKHKLKVILSYNLGLTAKPDLAQISSQTNRPSLLALLDSVRAYILALQYPDGSTAGAIAYGGTEPFVTPDGIPLAAYSMNFSLITSLSQAPFNPITIPN